VLVALACLQDVERRFSRYGRVTEVGLQTINVSDIMSGKERSAMLLKTLQTAAMRIMLTGHEGVVPLVRKENRVSAHG
jgi:hypothetical protein